MSLACPWNYREKRVIMDYHAENFLEKIAKRHSPVGAAPLSLETLRLGQGI